MKVKIKKLHKDAIVPQYQTQGSAGFDLHAIEKCVLKAGSIALIKTGLAMEIDSGFELQIRPRSGLALKNQITVLNSPGTIDSDYRGEIMVILCNYSNQDFDIKEGDRIAQGVIAKYERADFEVCAQLSDTQRGSGGFGSSGV
ncbi:dUTP diphosphatase [Helicobacter anseris]|uniref:Deoxyuridine 5'-triphosphate nucleotidohydrolase n=1 Tax=Helicobacter anseris TaxID=375926 RepID=A0A3D8JBF7_9HELI|nr:dUTP diphosphatase [Helicobacter anseris]RDU74194.1 dUTP diphosphatase [Helicobacter anseris]